MFARPVSCFAIRYGLVPKAVSTRAVFEGFYARSEASFWLDGAAAGTRFSFLGDSQGPLSEILAAGAGDDAVSVRQRDVTWWEAGSAFEVLDSRLEQRRIGPTSLPFDFVGGYVGYLGPVLDPSPIGAGSYDFWNFFARDHDRRPDSLWLFADRVIAVDHWADVTYVLAVEDGRWAVRAAADLWIADTMRRVRLLPRHADRSVPSGARASAADAVLERHRSRLPPTEGCRATLVPGGHLAMASALDELPATEPYLAQLSYRGSLALSRPSARTQLLGRVAEPGISYPAALGYFGLAGVADVLVRTVARPVLSIKPAPRRPAVC